MSSDLRIRRDRSVLSDGSMFGRRRRGLQTWKLGLWFVAMGFMGVVIWQFNNIQPKVLGMIGTGATPTPPAIVYARNADLAFQRGDIDAAITNYREAIKQTPNNVDLLYELARMLIYHSYADRRFVNQDVPEAVELGLRAATAAPNNSRAHTIYCFALTTAGKSEDGVRECIRAIDLDNTNSEAHAYLASAYADLQRIDSGLEMAQKAVELNDMSIDAHTNYALILWYKGKFDAALDHFKKAADINPRLEFPYFNLAYFAVGTNRYEIAISAYNSVLSRNNRSVKAYTRLCETYYRMGETNLAKDNCKNAITLDKEYTAAYKWYGQVLYTRRDYEDALDNFRICAEQEIANNIPPSDRLTECWYLRGLAYFLLDECDKAMPIFNDILSWTHDENAIKLTNTGIRKCATAYQGLYTTPTPIPPTPTRPPPIQ
ncbi:MAG: tetratricopeptide repeat protein [Anaerolineae bacterium]|nr:tetratricopeptide repeat protein [Anaerolineae bacterium]